MSAVLLAVVLASSTGTESTPADPVFVRLEEDIDRVVGIDSLIGAPPDRRLREP